MSTLSRIALAVGLICLLFAGRPGPAAAGTCSSSIGCKDCDETTTTFKCTTVQSAASCTCEVFIFGGTPACGVDGDCVYLSGGGGGVGGGGGGGGGGCTRTPGEWCPADCASCTAVFWY